MSQINFKLLSSLLGSVLSFYTENEIQFNKLSNTKILIASLNDPRLRLSKSITLFYAKSLLESNTHPNLQTIYESLYKIDESYFNEYKYTSISKDIKLSKSMM